MRISLNWLNQLVDIETVNLEHLLEKLTLGGFEVEELLKLKIDKKKEIIIDVSATANRTDSLSIKGIARELISLINIKQKQTYFLTDNLKFKNEIKKISIPSYSFKDCTLFFTMTIENIVNFNSPYWLKQKLLSAGILPLNNLLDYQNYILIETGYPFEFYDLEKVKKKSETSSLALSLEFPKNETKFIGNDNLEYSLDKKVLIFKINDEILSIAGILPNKEFSYTQKTNSLLIEGAIYNPQKIRKTSRLLNLRTNRSARYEKGLTSYYFIESFYRLISLLRISNPNLVCQLITAYQKNERILKPIQLKYENITKILGSTKRNDTIENNPICKTKISNYLNRLNCKYNFNTETLSWRVQVPDFRSDDITREIDLVEEIGRFCGFNKFMICLPQVKKVGLKDFSYQIREKITCHFLNEGLNELINYSFVKKNNTNSIQLLNPLLNDSKNLRNSLLPNIIKTIKEISKQTNTNIEGFEFGHVFSKNENLDYKEVEFISGIFGGIQLKTLWSKNTNVLSWFEAKSKIEELFLKLNLSVNWKSLKKNNYDQLIHPYRAAELYLNNKIYIGIFGQIQPVLAQKLNLSSQLFLFEFNFELIKNELKKSKLSFFKNYSIYPKILKDLSFIVNCNVSFEKIRTTILLQDLPYLIQVNLLDEYQGKLIPEFSKSLCVQLVFQANEKTLITKDIEEIFFKIESTIIKKFNAEIRIS